jgi:hypothetical protein
MTSRHKKKKETDPKESSDSSSKQLGKGEFRDILKRQAM